MTELTKITSRDNQHLVRARKVRDGRVGDMIFVEGKRLVREALRSGIAIEEAFVQEGFADQELAEAAVTKASFAAELPERLLASIADTEHPQGIAIVGRRPEAEADAIERRLESGDLPLVVCLHGINNPSNLGAVLRTAEAAGVAGIILTSGSADPCSPKALRASMGAAFRLAMLKHTNLYAAAQWAGELGMVTTATAAGAGVSYTAIDWRLPRMLVFGSEAHGLSEAELSLMSEQVSIGMRNDVESLNLAVSAGVILFEARRQVMTVT